MSDINPSRTRQRVKIFPVSKHESLDRFILCRWNIIYGCMVETSGNSLETLLSEIPEHLHDGDDDTLCVCEVISWRGDDDMNELDVHESTTLYQLEHYADPSEEDEDEIEQRIAELKAQLQKEKDHYEGLMSGEIPAGFDVNEKTRGKLSAMQRAALKKMGNTAKELADEIAKL